MKKILSYIMLISMVLNIQIPVFASNDDAPVLYEEIAGTKPGDTLMLYGHALSGSKFFVNDTEVTPVELGDTCVKLKIPKELDLGVYEVKVQNSYGSDTHKINKADIWWTQGNQGKNASKNGQLKIMGKNLALSENVSAKLTNTDEQEYNLTIDYYNNNEVTASTKDIPSGIYTLHYNNGTGEYVTFDNIEIKENIRLSQNIYNVTDYGVRPDTDTDCSTGVRLAMLDARRYGGSVYFPVGDYIFNSRIEMFDGVSLIGQDKEATRLIFKAPASAESETTHMLSNLIKMGRNSTIKDLSVCVREVFTQAILLNNNCSVDNVYIYSNRINKETIIGSDYTLAENKLNGISIYANGIQDFSVTNCEIVGDGGGIMIAESDYGFVDSNVISAMVPGKLTNCCHIIFSKNDYNGAYLYSGGLGIAGITSYFNLFSRNRFQDIYGGDRESMTFDDHGSVYYGTIKAISGTTITLTQPLMLEDNGKDTLSESKFLDCYNRLDKTVEWYGVSVYILDGKGKGQYRNLVSIDGENQVTVDREWDVTPDTTSLLSIGKFSGKQIFTYNEFYDSGTGVQLYAPGIANIISHNKSYRGGSTNATAVYTSYDRETNPEAAYYMRIEPSFYNVFEDNTLEEALGWNSNSSSLSLNSNSAQSIAFGNIIRRNTIKEPGRLIVNENAYDTVVEGNTVYTGETEQFIVSDNCYTSDNQHIYSTYVVPDGAKNILDYGVTPYSTTDKTEAFKTALSELKFEGGGVLYVPSGYYWIKGMLEVPDNVTILGENTHSSVIYWKQYTHPDVTNDMTEDEKKALNRTVNNHDLICGGSNIAVKNITINVDNAHQDVIKGQNLTAENLVIRADAYKEGKTDYTNYSVPETSYGSGIVVTGGSAIIKNCDIVATNCAVKFENVTEGIIDNSNIRGGSRVLAVVESSNISVTNSTLRGMNIYANGMTFAGVCSGITINNNTIQNLQGMNESAIFKQDSATLSNINISDNNFRNLRGKSVNFEYAGSGNNVEYSQNNTDTQYSEELKTNVHDKNIPQFYYYENFNLEQKKVITHSLTGNGNELIFEKGYAEFKAPAAGGVNLVPDIDETIPGGYVTMESKIRFSPKAATNLKNIGVQVYLKGRYADDGTSANCPLMTIYPFAVTGLSNTQNANSNYLPGAIAFTPDEWYDVKLGIDTQNGRFDFFIKKSDFDEWHQITPKDGFSVQRTKNNGSDAEGNPRQLVTLKYGIDGIYFNLVNNAAIDGGSICIDDISIVNTLPRSAEAKTGISEDFEDYSDGDWYSYHKEVATVTMEGNSQIIQKIVSLNKNRINQITIPVGNSATLRSTIEYFGFEPVEEKAVLSFKLKFDEDVPAGTRFAVVFGKDFDEDAYTKPSYPPLRITKQSENIVIEGGGAKGGMQTIGTLPSACAMYEYVMAIDTNTKRYDMSVIDIDTGENVLVTPKDSYILRAPGSNVDDLTYENMNYVNYYVETPKNTTASEIKMANIYLDDFVFNTAPEYGTVYSPSCIIKNGYIEVKGILLGTMNTAESMPFAYKLHLCGYKEGRLVDYKSVDLNPSRFRTENINEQITGLLSDDGVQYHVMFWETEKQRPISLLVSAAAAKGE